MKVLKFYGGLGNQMFQYAMLICIRETFHDNVLGDTSLYSSYNKHNGFELDRVFNISINRASKKQIQTLSRYTSNYRLFRFYHFFTPQKKTEYREKDYGKYYPDVFLNNNDCLFDGYWQHHEYFDRFKVILKKEFSLKEVLDKRNLDLFNLCLSYNSMVSIHIRRGDYLKKTLYKNICDVDYYLKAVSKVKEIIGPSTRFIVFSNDISWCRNNLPCVTGDPQTIFVDWNTGSGSYKDMVLMSACRVNIIANSSFSWWGAYLNLHKDPIVFAPKKWINKRVSNPIQLPGWILI